MKNIRWAAEALFRRMGNIEPWCYNRCHRLETVRHLFIHRSAFHGGDSFITDAICPCKLEVTQMRSRRRSVLKSIEVTTELEHPMEPNKRRHPAAIRGDNNPT
jgi:hypothetical protein